MTSEWERKLRAVTCEGCAMGEALVNSLWVEGIYITGAWHVGQGRTLQGHKTYPCASKHVELLPLFEQAHLAGQLQQQDADAKIADYYVFKPADLVPSQGVSNAIRNAPLPPASQEALDTYVSEKVHEQIEIHDALRASVLAAKVRSAEARARLKEARWWDLYIDQHLEKYGKEWHRTRGKDRVAALAIAAESPKVTPK